MVIKSNLITHLAISIFLLTMTGLTQAATITVGLGADYDFNNVQAGIDTTVDGDTVLVAPGEYIITEPITFRGKAIEVISEVGPDETTIRMGTPADTNNGSVVLFENNETTDSVLEGFTIAGGRGSLRDGQNGGGGIMFNAASGTVRNCAIVQNTSGWGGGICGVYQCSPALIDCTIAENSCVEDGGGVLTILGCSMTLTNCIIRGNSNTGVENGGGGVSAHIDSFVTMTDCIISGNSSKYVGGGVHAWETSLNLTRCTIVNNTAEIWSGGGAFIAYSSTTLTDCIISGNSATLNSGGGVSCAYYSTMTMKNCTITGNSAPISGGGMGCYYGSSIMMTDCFVSENSTVQNGGGGVECWDGTVTMNRCAVIGNTVKDSFAGGIFVGHGSAILNNCIIARNTASRGGGGVASSYRAGTSLTINNCTIWGNSGGSYGGGGGVLCYNSSATITNSIICGNTSPKGSEISVEDPASTLTIAYSNIADGQVGINVENGCMINWGNGNIDVDPLFARLGCGDDNGTRNPSDDFWVQGDYHLKSQAGRYDPNSQSWVIDNVTSPCIDAGDPNSPAGDEPNPNGGIINMGAYGGTAEASKSP